MNILVTGGAGYIGSILTERLLEEGHKVVVIDNFQSGHKKAIPEKAYYYPGNFHQPGLMLEKTLTYENIELVIHIAASMSPSTSMLNPQEYFQNNIEGSLKLINTMLNCKVNKIIFASSGCVYGTPQRSPVGEEDLKIPTTPYGDTKLMFERILEWYKQAYSLNYIVFRYFNVAGAGIRLGSDKSQNNGLICNALDVAMGKTAHLPVFGSDYPTEDGSCIRDYVHIRDIVQAHILAIETITTSGGVYNLGSGTGQSVFDVVKCARKVTNEEIPIKVQPRRPGDPPILVADISKVREKLGWNPHYSDLDTIIRSSYHWLLRHPRGYE